jgi:hypothetical protein
MDSLGYVDLKGSTPLVQEVRTESETQHAGKRSIVQVKQ